MEWRVCSECPEYEVSEFGDIRRLRATKYNPVGSLVKLRSKKRGYLYVSAYRLGPRVKNFHVHRLVAMAFIGPPPTSKHHAAHNDGRCFNNHFSNLRWATALENNLDIAKHDKYKLKNAQVIQLRDKFLSGASRKDLAKEFGLHPSYVSVLINRKHRNTA